MGHIRLSVCIPTYNFGEFIGDTLESIVTQATDEVEIIVVDGGSADNTATVVHQMKQRFPRLTYCRKDHNSGVDKDLATAVELAQGDYCWLMSSDDVLKPGAIARILHELTLGHDIYLCNRTECNHTLRPVKDGSWLGREFHDQVFTLSNQSEWVAYLNASQSLGALFSYISSIIVSRKKWNEITYDEIFTGTNYAHVFRLLSIMTNGGVLKYIKDGLVFCRRGNDSFSNKGAAHRLLIDLNGYELLAQKLFIDADIRAAFMGVMRRQHVWFLLAGLRNDVDDVEVWNELETRLIAFDYPPTILKVARILGSSKVVIKSARYLKRIERGVRIVMRKATGQNAVLPGGSEP